MADPKGRGKMNLQKSGSAVYLKSLEPSEAIETTTPNFCEFISPRLLEASMELVSVDLDGFDKFCWLVFDTLVFDKFLNGFDQFGLVFDKF